MEASPVNIIQYFDGSKQGVIPLFQRPYSWGPQNWDTLWEDLIGQYDPADRSSHFMGAIVTVPVRSVPVGVSKHLVIDGQQRLTTIALLLAALRGLATEQKDALTAGVIGDFLVNRYFQAPDDLKLVPTQVDRAAFNAVIYQKPLDEHDESRIVQAFEYFQDLLRGRDENGEAFRAHQVREAIQQSLQVVMINLSEADDPYLIFESLNHKGKPLSQADLVRNYVLMRFQHSTSSGGEQEVVYEALWRPMESRLDSAMSEFLRHHAMRHGRNVRKGDIYTASKAEFEKLQTPDELRARLGAMKTSGLSYAGFLDPGEATNERTRRGLAAIQALDSTVFYPLLLRLQEDIAEGRSDSEEFNRVLVLLESFYVRRLACGVPTNALNKMTLELCGNLPSAGQADWLISRLEQGAGARRWPDDAEFEAALVTQSLYPRHKMARHMLRALEESYDHKEPVDTTTATIEHIMPQTLSPEWIADLGSDYAEIHATWLNTLGNLTLTGYNSELGNLSFEEKQRRLANTHFELSRSLLAEGKWSAPQIERRGKALARMALTRWPRSA